MKGDPGREKITFLVLQFFKRGRDGMGRGAGGVGGGWMDHGANKISLLHNFHVILLQLQLTLLFIR